VLSGMSTMRHVEENLEYAEARACRDAPASDELALVARRARALPRAESDPLHLVPVLRALPPRGSAIPEILELYNDAHMYGEPARQRLYYTWLDEGERADRCTACGECEEQCPQGIAIATWMETAQAFLGADR